MPITDQMSTLRKEPPVLLDAAYAERLHGLASTLLQRAPDVAERLLHEIERADVLPSSELPADVVNIGSDVTFHDEATGRTQTVTLVFPPDADIAAGRVSVLTPIGAALIGLAAGASISWETRTGEERTLTVTQVKAAPSGAKEDGSAD